MTDLDVIIPAGGKLNQAFTRVAGTSSKALIQFEGATVLSSTIDALRECRSTRRIVVVGSQEVLDNPDSRLADAALLETTSGPQNILKGLKWLLDQHQAPEHVMIVTCDLPFVTAETFEKFLSLCPAGKDFCVPLISRESFGDAFPGTSATFVKLIDGTWTTGCAYLVSCKGLMKAIGHIEAVFKNRKSKLGMAKLLGMRFVYGLLTQKLTVTDVERKVEQLLHCVGVAVPGSPPELAFDIDYIDDYHYALQTRKLLKGAH